MIHSEILPRGLWRLYCASLSFSKCSSLNRSPSSRPAIGRNILIEHLIPVPHSRKLGNISSWPVCFGKSLSFPFLGRRSTNGDSLSGGASNFQIKKSIQDGTAKVISGVYLGSKTPRFEIVTALNIQREHAVYDLQGNRQAHVQCLPFEARLRTVEKLD